jgi:hypothetical protein
MVCDALVQVLFQWCWIPVTSMMRMVVVAILFVATRRDEWSEWTLRHDERPRKYVL